MAKWIRRTRFVQMPNKAIRIKISTTGEDGTKADLINVHSAMLHISLLFTGTGKDKWTSLMQVVGPHGELVDVEVMAVDG